MNEPSSVATQTATRPSETAVATPRQTANRIGRRFGLLGGALALAQVVVSTTTSAAHQAALVVIDHQAPILWNYVLTGTLTGVVGVPQPETLAAPIAVGCTSGCLGGVGALLVAFFAARAGGQATDRPALGRRAGMVAAALGALWWLGLSVASAALSGTDGFLASVDPLSATPLWQQTLGVVWLAGLRALVAGLLGLPIALLAAEVGARSGVARRRRSWSAGAGVI